MQKAIIEEEPALLPESISPFIKDILRLLLDKNPENRPNASELLKK